MGFTGLQSQPAAGHHCHGSAQLLKKLCLSQGISAAAFERLANSKSHRPPPKGVFVLQHYRLLVMLVHCEDSVACHHCTAFNDSFSFIG